MEHSDTNTEPLPEYWPPDTQQPKRPVWLPWPVAVVLAPILWVLPKRMGPHWAASRWTGAIVAHLFWTIYGIGCIVNAYHGKYYSWVAYISGQTPGGNDHDSWMAPTFSQLFRTPLAAIINSIFYEVNVNLIFFNNITVDSSVFILTIVSVVAGTILAVLILSFLLMPFVTAGERWRFLFARCVKLTLWVTTSLLVLGFALQTIELFADTHGHLYTEAAIALYIVFFLWIWIRSGMRYAGEAEGPSWQPRRPQCERCGYILTGLTPKDVCPECGLAIVESLPQSRQAAIFAQAGHILPRFSAFWKTVVKVLFQSDFFGRISIHNNLAPARHFAIWVCVVTGLIFFVVGYSSFTLLLGTDTIDLGNDWGDALGLIVGLTTIFGCCLAVVSLLVLVVSRFGYYPIKPLATLIFYFSPWLLPLAACTATAITGILYEEEMGYLSGWIHLWDFAKIDKVFIYPLIPLSFPAVVFILAGLRLRRALRQTRFTNS